jgi:hypothetical protein
LFRVPVHIFRFESDREVFRWGVTPDGKRFLLDAATTSPDPLTVVLNWAAESKKE